jgi:hypothetical protein
MSERKFNAAWGLPLSRNALRVLKNAGIYAPPLVTLEHQHLAKRYVVRGLEAGGAIQELGRYITFAGPGGERIEYLHAVESIAVNGLHAVVIAPLLLRVDMLRKGRTYEVLITEHQLGTSDNGAPPKLESNVLFRGVHGRIELDLCGEDKAEAGSVLPIFYSLAGEPVSIPKKFIGVLKAAARGANCFRCEHAHYLLRPRAAPMPAAATAVFGAAPSETPTAVTGLIQTVPEEQELGN